MGVRTGVLHPIETPGTRFDKRSRVLFNSRSTDVTVERTPVWETIGK